MYMTLHWGDNYQDGHASAGGVYAGPDFTADFHTYAVDWDADRVVWLVDGAERFRYEGPGVPQVDMYMITNLAIGGSWPGAPDPSTPFPAYYDIDYVRVYERGSDAGVTPPAEPVDADAAPPDASDTPSGPAVPDAPDGLDTGDTLDTPRADAGAADGSSGSGTWWEAGEGGDGCGCRAAGSRGHAGLFYWSLAALMGLLRSRRGR
jgi:beta-glucanase (GH16 family)